jgi:hypothetical protein
MTTVTCDRCRHAIQANLTTVQFLGVFKNTMDQIDLCGPCARELLDWLRSGPVPGATPRIESDGT